MKKGRKKIVHTKKKTFQFDGELPSYRKNWSGMNIIYTIILYYTYTIYPSSLDPFYVVVTLYMMGQDLLDTQQKENFV